MKVRTRKLMRSESGTALVEFALLVPVMAFLLVGVIDVGRYAYYAMVAANAARAGAQYGAENTQTVLDAAGMQTAALTDGQNLPNLTATGSHICLLDTTQTACPTTGTRQSNWVYYAVVDTSGQFHPLFSYPGIPNPLTISGRSIMRVVGN
jgi:Flp pilus assembly protein TadG